MKGSTRKFKEAHLFHIENSDAVYEIYKASIFHIFVVHIHYILGDII